MIRLAIVICTFRREELLERALLSIAAQTFPAAVDIEVLVVDNSDEGSAEPVVARLSRSFPSPLRWIAAHPANISVARNAGVAAATGDYIAFVDDDQRLEPGWLEAVADAVMRLPHDVFFGAMIPDFEAPEQATPLVRQLFSRQHPAAAGADLVAMGPGKTQGLTLATANSVFRRAAMLISDPVFDMAFGDGGGEDYDLICRMERRGSRFAWMPGARVQEFVPAARCDSAYLRRRFYAGGQAYAAAIANASPSPALTRGWLRLKALVQLGLLAARLPLRLLRGGPALADHRHAIAGVLGKLSFARIHPLYRAADARAAAAADLAEAKSI